MEIVVPILIMLVCLASEAFFSGSEIGVVSADRMKLRHDNFHASLLGGGNVGVASRICWCVRTDAGGRTGQ